MTKTETRNDKLRAAHDKLQEAVAEIASDDASGTLTCSFPGIRPGTWADGRFSTVVDFEGATNQS